MHDRYGSDVLNTDWRAPKRGRAVEIDADKGLVVEEVTTGTRQQQAEAAEILAETRRKLYGLLAEGDPE